MLAMFAVPHEVHPRIPLHKRTPSTTSSKSSQSRMSQLSSMFRSPKHGLPALQNPPEKWPDSFSIFSVSSTTGRQSVASLAVPQYPSTRSLLSLSSSRSRTSAFDNASLRSEVSRPDGATASSVYSSSAQTLGLTSSAPPSAYRLRRGDTRPSHSRGTDSEGSNPETSPADIRAEIEAVEAEAIRLLDVFAKMENEATRRLEGELGHRLMSREGSEGDWTVVPGSAHRPSPSSTLSPSAPDKPSSRRFSRRTLSHSPAQHRNSLFTPSHTHLSSSTAYEGVTLTHLSSPTPYHPSSSIVISSTLPSSASSAAPIPSARFTSDTSTGASPLKTPDVEEAYRKLEDVRSQVKEFEAKLDRRLAFLHGKLRAAEIQAKARR